MRNRICSLFNIDYPIIQAGMIWCSGWELASAVSNAGGLGVIGSGSMRTNVLEEHIQKYQRASTRPFAVNLPLLYPDIKDHVEVIIKNKVPIVFTSAGNPGLWTPTFKEHNIVVVHVVSSLKFALKSQEVGVDAVVAEGFEAGGHNGREETTTLCLIPSIAGKIDIPLIAAGGIASGRSMLAVMNLGADGVQIGSRFIASPEASAHQHFKKAILATREGDTQLTLKELTPVRLIKNEFFQQIQQAYQNKATRDELKNLLGTGRAKKGMFLGDLIEGELEVGQIAGTIDKIMPAKEIIDEIIDEFYRAKNEQSSSKFTFQ